MGHFVFRTLSVLQQKKSITFKVTKISHYFTFRGNKKLIYLNSHRYCLKNPQARAKCIDTTLNVVSFTTVVWSLHTTPPILRKRERERERARWRRNLIGVIQFKHVKNCSPVIGNI